MKEYFLIFPDKENREDGERIDQTLCEADYSVGDRLTLVHETEEKHYTVRGINHFLKDGLKHVSTAVLLGDAEQKEQSNSNWGIWFSWLDAINAATLLLSRIWQKTYSIKLDYKLCYVEENFAWFTTGDIDKVRGDDWNDVPYEHNAGTPYKWDARYNVPEYNLCKIAFERVLDVPGGEYTNSNYSVNMINRGDVAWLSIDKYNEITCGMIEIYAGCTLPEFERLIDKAGGRIYR